MVLSLDNPSARNRIEIIGDMFFTDIEVRGGIGNKRLIGWESKRGVIEDNGEISWSKGSTEEKESAKLTLEKKKKISQLRDNFTKNNTINIDYILHKNYPKEWENIKSAAEVFKMNRKDKSIVAVFLGSVISFVGWLITIIL